MPGQGLMAGLFSSPAMQGLPEETRRGLVDAATREMGLRILAGAQSPNIGATLAGAVGAGRDVAAQGADYQRQIARQQEADDLRRQSAEALIESRQQAAEQARLKAQREAAELAKTQEGVQFMRQRLTSMGMDATSWPDKQVEKAFEDVASRHLEERLDAMYPDPVKPAKPPNLQYKQIGGVPHAFNPATGSLEPIPGAPVEAQTPKVDKDLQAEIESVVSTLDALGAAQRFPGLLEEVRAELAAIKDPVQRRMRAEEILAAASRAQRQSMGLE